MSDPHEKKFKLIAPSDGSKAALPSQVDDGATKVRQHLGMPSMDVTPTFTLAGKEEEVWRKIEAQRFADQYLEESEASRPATAYSSTNVGSDGVSLPSDSEGEEPEPTPSSKHDYPSTPESVSMRTMHDFDALLQDHSTSKMMLDIKDVYGRSNSAPSLSPTSEQEDEDGESSKPSVTSWYTGKWPRLEDPNKFRYREFIMDGPEEPPVEEPQVEDQATAPLPPKVKSKRKKKKALNISFSDSNSMFEYEEDGKRTKTPPPYSHVEARVNTGLAQIRKEASKASSEGTSLGRQDNYHPITIASRFNPKSLVYEGLKAHKIQTYPSLSMRTRLHRNLGAFHNIQHRFDPPTYNRQMVNVFLPTIGLVHHELEKQSWVAEQIKKDQQQHRTQGQVKVIRAPSKNLMASSLLTMATTIGTTSGNNNIPPPQRKGLFQGTNNLQRYNAAKQQLRQMSKGFASTRASASRHPTPPLKDTPTTFISPYLPKGYGNNISATTIKTLPQNNYNSNKATVVQPQQTQLASQPRIWRPSQLLPLHVPGPKAANIYITSYSDEVERPLQAKIAANVPVKSRKR